MTENQRLKIIRKSLKLTQLEFGASLGLTQAGYSDIERGKNNVSGKIKILLKREHNINLNWLKTGEGEMFSAPVEDNGFNTNQFSKDQNLLNLQSEIDRLNKEVNRLTAENILYSDLIKSKNLNPDNLEA